MRVLVVTVQVPFVRGGAEILAESLRNALSAAGHEADIAAIPFQWHPAERIIDHLLACRLLDVTGSMGRSIERVIALKFPAYAVPHPNKVVWLVHQHRQAYELWQQPAGCLHREPEGVAVREAIRKADRSCLPEARAIFAISNNVAGRLRRFNGLEAGTLYPPPPHADRYTTAEAEDYLFFPSRLGPAKRQLLVLEALARTRLPVQVRFAGEPDEPGYDSVLHRRAHQLGVADRVQWLGRISEDDKRRLYAHSRAVVFPPVDEDYGFITLEAMLASTPVITCTDSGGPLEFIRHGETGLIAEPTPEALADALDRLWSESTQARRWGRAARDAYTKLNIGWNHVVERLTA